MHDIERNSNATIVYIRSEITFAHAAEFFDLLMAACSDSERLIVSLQDGHAIDCAGLSALIRLRNVISIPMSIVVPDDSFQSKLFTLAGLRERLSVIRSSGAATAVTAIRNRPGIRTSYPRRVLSRPRF